LRKEPPVFPCEEQARLEAASFLRKEMRRGRRKKDDWVRCLFETLVAIEKLTKEQGLPPTISEIGEVIGAKSTAGVVRRLAALHAHGLIRLGYPKKRKIFITERGKLFLAERRKRWRKKK
jgi:hypothetical protein